jgi:hypothetical protein
MHRLDSQISLLSGGDRPGYLGLTRADCVQPALI